MKSFFLQLLIAFFIIQLISLYQKRNLLKEKAPDFTLIGLDGKPYSLNENKKYLLYFFAPWCPICQISFDNLSRVKSWRKNALEVYAIALSYESIDEVQEFVRRYETNFPILLGNSKIAQDFKIEGFPTFYVVDEEKQISSSGVGYTSSLGMWWRTF